MSVDRLRIIEEVRKRPLLWDCQNPMRNNRQIAALWSEIGEILDTDVTICKRTWKRLRMQFCNEANRIPARIAKAKRNGVYNPNKRYYTWAFFDYLKFVVDGRSPKAKFDPNFGNDSDIEIVENNNTEQIQAHLLENSSFQTESDNDIEIVECGILDQRQDEKEKYFENYYESDNDIEFIDNDDPDQTQCRPGNCSANNFLQKETDIPSPVIPVADSDESTPEFKSYPVSLTSCVQDTEYPTSISVNAVLQSEPIKEEPELQIETEKPLYDGNIIDFQEDKSLTMSAHELSSCSENSSLLMQSKERETNDLEKHTSSPRDINADESEHQGIQTFSEEQISCSPSSNDEDYSFLYSFLSQTKAMTQLQKMEFRVNMKNLLVHIFPASASVNILEKQLLLPEDNDPDRKFLISFWPFIKSMSLTQNLQFRAKMADLVLQILSSEAIL